jgi:transcriptional regulator NrdR family protein
MNCPECNAPTKVFDTRPKANFQHRRRECLNCTKRFTTREYTMEDLIRLKAEYLTLQDEVKRLKVADKMVFAAKGEFKLL